MARTCVYKLAVVVPWQTIMNHEHNVLVATSVHKSFKSIRRDTHTTPSQLMGVIRQHSLQQDLPRLFSLSIITAKSINLRLYGNKNEEWHRECTQQKQNGSIVQGLLKNAQLVLEENENIHVGVGHTPHWEDRLETKLLFMDR